MRVLLVHPEDSPLHGPWATQRWDLVVDLGQSASFSHRRWAAALHCPVLCSDSCRPGYAGALELRGIFSAGHGYLVDEEGIDYWDLVSLVYTPEALVVLEMQRLIAELPVAGELWCTRGDWPVGALSVILQRRLKSFAGGWLQRATAGASHYAAIARNFSSAQIKQIAFDKFDAGYRWRRHLAISHKACREQVVLVPSAYENVSRMAAAYAATLPEQAFLLVATRRSGTRFAPRSNIALRDLASYASGNRSRREADSLLQAWQRLKANLEQVEVLRILLQGAAFDTFPGWVRNSIAVRNAWRTVLTEEPVSAVLCGDDTNPFTRLPVLLAARRKVPTADFHHGALDGRYLFKELPSDFYLAKNEMERDYLLRLCRLPPEKVFIAPPDYGVKDQIPAAIAQAGKTALVLFSEPYEIAGLRVEEVYGELLPLLWRVASENNRSLVIKLHPFESLSQRRRVLREILPARTAADIRLIAGPMTQELLENAWCGITIESTTALECQQRGVCCFLCGWMKMSPFEYQQQYARFGVGALLRDPEQIGDLPRLIAEFHARPAHRDRIPAAAPGFLRDWLATRTPPNSELKPA